MRRMLLFVLVLSFLFIPVSAQAQRSYRRSQGRDPVQRSIRGIMADVHAIARGGYRDYSRYGNYREWGFRTPPVVFQFGNTPCIAPDGYPCDYGPYNWGQRYPWGDPRYMGNTPKNRDIPPRDDDRLVEREPAQHEQPATPEMPVVIMTTVINRTGECILLNGQRMEAGASRAMDITRTPLKGAPLTRGSTCAIQGVSDKSTDTVTLTCSGSGR